MNQETEKKKYDHIWNNFHKNYKSRAADPYALYIAKSVFPTDKILDIGCGDGSTVTLLNAAGFNCSGIDITLAGLEKYHKDYNKTKFFEGTIWDLPFEDKSFDVVISTDMFEHIPPEYIDKAIAETFRVCKREAYHCIASYPERPYCDEEVHLTVHPWDWWNNKFTELLETLPNTSALSLVLLDRKEFDKASQQNKLNELINKRNHV